MTQDKFTDTISLARTRLTSEWPFIGHLCLNMRPRMASPNDGVPTAAVSADGTLTINPEFLATLTQAEVCGLLAHEVLHPALFYFARKGDRNALVEINGGQVVSAWNLAHDLSFNTMIADQKSPNIKLPTGAALNNKYRDKSAEEIYDEILAEAKRNGSSAQGANGAACGKVREDSSIGDDARDDLSESSDGKKAAGGCSTARRKIENEWKVSVVAAAQAQEQHDKGRGTMPAWLQRMIHEIVNPKLDWREELSRWVGENGPRSDYSYRRPSRRSSSCRAVVISRLPVQPTG
jgi:predicted metal-dependent peptidase